MYAFFSWLADLFGAAVSMAAEIWAAIFRGIAFLANGFGILPAFLNRSLHALGDRLGIPVFWVPVLIAGCLAGLVLLFALFGCAINAYRQRRQK